MADSINSMVPTFTNLFGISKSSLRARLANLDTISNDLANVNSTGYKSVRGNFQELLNDSLQNSGTRLDATQRILTQGPMQSSDSPYSMAIQGDGFFAITLPDGTTAFTRDGTFSLDTNRKIVTADGYPMVWSGTQIPANTEDIQVSSQGRISVYQGGKWNEIGTMKLYRFANPTGLTANGKNQFLVSNASGPAQEGTPGVSGYGEVIQKMVEGSNVNLSEEMTEMVVTQRSYQFSMRVYQQTDQMLSLALTMRR